MKNKNGFTLIELLIVITIIAIVAIVIFVALDPITKFQKARDAQRYSDVTDILDTIKLDQIDNGGSYLASVATGITAGKYYIIGTNGTTGCDTGCTAQTTEADCVDLTELITDGYLKIIPTDPKVGSTEKTAYYLMKSSTGTITIGACNPENATAIAIAQ